MGRSVVQKLASCVLLMAFPASLMAADAETATAMLFTDGAAWVNGGLVPRTSSALFSGDLLQTRSDSVANINSPGSNVTVLADSLIQYQGQELKLEHGGLNVATSKGLAAVAGNVKVTPASDAWTEFNVTDLDGTVRIAARKGDILISDGQSTTTLAQGQQTTRDESSDQSSGGKKKSNKQTEGAPPAAGGGILNSPLAVGIGTGIIIGGAAWVLVHNDHPASPSNPN